MDLRLVTAVDQVWATSVQQPHEMVLEVDWRRLIHPDREEAKTEKATKILEKLIRLLSSVENLEDCDVNRTLGDTDRKPRQDSKQL